VGETKTMMKDKTGIQSSKSSSKVEYLGWNVWKIVKVEKVIW